MITGSSGAHGPDPTRSESRPFSFARSAARERPMAAKHTHPAPSSPARAVPAASSAPPAARPGADRRPAAAGRASARLLGATTLVALGLVACRAPDPDRSGLLEPYRVAIPQGNYLTKENLAQVREGMTPEQVRFALGTPLVQDPFRPDRWDYVFRYQRANGQAVLRRATVVFQDAKVARIEDSGLPERDDPSDQALPGARTARPMR
jgi:outer membrane protein assembly factor BamE